MPELPEVETVRIGLQRLLPGRIVAKVTHDNAKSFPNAKSDVDNFLIGASVINVKRRAKVLLIELNTDYSLVIHLKMTGQLVFVPYSRHPELVSGPRSPKQASGDLHGALKQDQDDENKEEESRFGAGHPNESLIGNLPDKSTRVTLTFNDNSQLFFNDQRKFGWMRLMPTIEVMNLDFFKKVGPEPLSADFTWQILKARMLRRKNSNVKSVILDQSVLAGVGNIYADESLWGAQIHPATLVKDLKNKDFQKLYEELIFVLELAIEKGGSTNRNYVNAEGEKGSYMSFARVFRREGSACPRCGTTIIKTRVAARGTHLCPKCQEQII